MFASSRLGRTTRYTGSYVEPESDEFSSVSGGEEVRCLNSDSEPLSDFVPEKRYSTDEDYEPSDQKDIETEDESDEEEEEEKEDGSFGTSPKFSTKGALSALDVATQQMIFDRLPLSKSNKATFFKWLTEEYAKEQEDAETRDGSDGDGEQEGSLSGEEEAVLGEEVDGHWACRSFGDVGQQSSESPPSDGQ